MLRFQLTPPHGGRHAGVFLRLADRSFNSRPRMGGDGSPESPCPSCTCFNSRPRMGGDGRPCGSACGPPVSTHAPAWGATFSALQSSFTGWFQLTPPHGGRPFQLLVGEVAAVSTHAPAWGATSSAASSSSTTTFQLTPPHGGRPGRPPSGPRGPRFNSRPRMGGDHSDRRGKSSRKVSTHAPAWGATLTTASAPPSESFNSRPRMGGDLILNDYENNLPVFQLTPPHGGRRCCRRPPLRPGAFTSRPRMGVDGGDTTATGSITFQLTPPHGGRPAAPVKPGELREFQLTPPHGGRHPDHLLRTDRLQFQLTPPHGGRRR